MFASTVNADADVASESLTINGSDSVTFSGAVGGINPFGSITTDAIKWCAAQNIAICVLDWLGDLVSVTAPPATTDVSLRRAQFAVDRLAVAKAILREKLASGRRIGKLAAQSCCDGLEEAKAARSVVVRRVVPMIVAGPSVESATSRQARTGLSSHAPMPQPMVSITSVFTRSIVAASRSS